MHRLLAAALLLGASALTVSGCVGTIGGAEYDANEASEDGARAGVRFNHHGLVEGTAPVPGAQTPPPIAQPAQPAEPPTVVVAAAPAPKATPPVIPKGPEPDDSPSAPDGTGAGNGSPVIVVLGSSTAAGVGASSTGNQWVERYRAYLRQNFPEFQLFNLAQGGFTTYEIQPSSYQPPANRPWPNTGRNISYALSLNPGAIIINMPSNDQQNRYSVDEEMANFERIAGLAAAQGVLLWVSTTQARNFSDADQRNSLMRTKDAIYGRFGDHTIDFWNGIANGDGTINSQYDSGDGTHLNDAGHKVLADRVQWANIPPAVRGW